MVAIAPPGGSVRDALLNVSGSESDPTQTITVDTYGPVIYVGEGKSFNARLTVAGAVAGTDPTLDVVAEASADGLTGFVTVASFPQRTATNLAATGAHLAPDRIVGVMPVGKGYLRFLFNIGGTNTPSFASTSVLLGPDQGYGI